MNEADTRAGKVEVRRGDGERLILVRAAEGRAIYGFVSLLDAEWGQLAALVRAEDAPSDDAECAARRASSGPGWPLESPPPGRHHFDSAGREWVEADADGRQWIRAGDLWYPSFPETMGTPASDDAEV